MNVNLYGCSVRHTDDGVIGQCEQCEWVVVMKMFKKTTMFSRHMSVFYIVTPLVCFSPDSFLFSPLPLHSLSHPFNLPPLQLFICCSFYFFLSFLFCMCCYSDNVMQIYSETNATCTHTTQPYQTFTKVIFNILLLFCWHNTI